MSTLVEVSSEVADALARRQARSWEEAMLQALARRQPDYLVVFPSWFPTAARVPGFRLVLVP